MLVETAGGAAAAAGGMAWVVPRAGEGFKTGGRPEGKADTSRIGAGGAGGADAAPLFGLEKYVLTDASSSSDKLANADPLPAMPSFLQASTSSLLSTFSSFASA
jgi:hypothetical protein